MILSVLHAPLIHLLLRLFLISHLFISFVPSHSHPLNLKPNSDWNYLCLPQESTSAASFTARACTKSDDETMRLFGLIRTLLLIEQRNVYFALETSWMDRILLPEALVNVHAVSSGQIRHLLMPQHPQLPLPKSEPEEVFQIIVIELAAGREEGENAFEFEGIDHFLSQNPCWMPLHEPQNLTSLVSSSSSSPSSLHSSHGNSNSNNNNKQTTSMSPRLRYLALAQHRVVVLVRLPVFGFQATCRLYAQIVLHQHPRTCRYDEEHMMVHHLHNTGWSATFNALLFKLQYIFLNKVYPSKVLVPTQAYDFRSRIRTLTDKNGTKFTTSGGWYWANPLTCPEEIEAYDPWHCNFISITNCSQKSQGLSLMNPPYPPASKDKSAETPMPVFAEGFDQQPPPQPYPSQSVRELRALYHDGPLHWEEQWIYHRMHAFLQRPSWRMRALIRKSFKAVEPIYPVPASSSSSSQSSLSSSSSDGSNGNNGGGGGGGGGRNRHDAHSHSNRHAMMSVTPLSLSVGMRRPCLTVHVRHGDSRHDTRGDAKRKIDRSLAAHVLHAANLTHSLAISHIFIASDNASIIARAPGDFPQYHWFTQRRPIKEWPGMYDVHNEDNIQLELAHVIVDTRVAASCDAIVASFDSGFAEQMVVASCSFSKQGRCAPSVDLREVYHDYG